MRLFLNIAGFAVGLVLLATTTTAFAQSDYDDDRTPATTPDFTTTEIDSDARLVLDYEPLLPDVESTRCDLTEILSQPEFLDETVDEPKGESIWERFFTWLSRALGRLGGSGSSNLFGLIAVVLLAVLILFLLVRMMWDFFGGRRFGSDKKLEGDSDNLAPVDLVALAAKAAGKGDYQLAIRFRFKAVLGELKISSGSVMTNHQVLRRLKRNMPFAVVPFGEIASIFEDTWYGQQPGTAQSYELVSEYAGKIEQELEGLEE